MGRELEGATGSDISSPLLEETCRKKEEQIQQIRDVKTQIQNILNEIVGYVVLSPFAIIVEKMIYLLEILNNIRSNFKCFKMKR